MFKSILSAVGVFFANIGHALSGAVQSVEPAAVTDFDALVAKYTPVAVDQVTAAADNPALLTSADKRAAAVAGLSTQLQADGHNIAADGFGSFVNLMVELGVNFVKLLSGKSLVVAAPAAQETTEQAEPAAQGAQEGASEGESDTKAGE